METLLRYFEHLTPVQRECFVRMGELYPEWNAKVNVISRKDIDNLYLHHILHSLSIARFWGDLEPDTTVLDLGTGGGFPGIPLATVYPDCHFHLIDRIGKKINVARSIADDLGLTNVTFQHGDIGECRQTFDFVVSRAVMSLDALVPLIVKNIGPGRHSENRYTPGLVCLKGGDIDQESKSVRYPVIEFPLNEFFAEEFFETKKLVYVPIKK